MNMVYFQMKTNRLKKKTDKECVLDFKLNQVGNLSIESEKQIPAIIIKYYFKFFKCNLFPQFF